MASVSRRKPDDRHGQGVDHAQVAVVHRQSGPHAPPDLPAEGVGERTQGTTTAVVAAACGQMGEERGMITAYIGQKRDFFVHPDQLGHQGQRQDFALAAHGTWPRSVIVGREMALVEVVDQDIDGRTEVHEARYPENISCVAAGFG